nr:GIY-YIG nuclease family protein [uncultured Desulfuromusa sp.]
MFSKDDEVLYVGKAKLLRNRLRSYFSARGDGRLHIPLLMEKVQRIEVIITDTEKEALLLENTLIKKYRPHYNIDLRDDKTYVSVRIDLNDPFPMMQVVRQVKNDGAHYFGPYSSASAIRETLKEIYRIFLCGILLLRVVVNGVALVYFIKLGNAVPLSWEDQSRRLSQTG